MTIRTSLLLLAFSSFSACAQQKIAFNNPPTQPEVFAPGLISTGFSERDFAISPDGTELFYTLQSAQTQSGAYQTILHRKKDKSGNWGAAQLAPFAGKFSDLEPAFSADGKQLFFASNRPLTGTTIKDFDIWVVEKNTTGTWGEPRNLGAPVNTPTDEFYPSVAKNGNLYFTASYKNAESKEDIWVATWQQGKYTSVAALDSNVNSKMYEFNAFVSPDEDYIIFTSYGRKDDKGGGDLYMSIKDATGKWQPSKNLAFLNSRKLDYCPYVSTDKKMLFFTSDRAEIKSSYPEKATTLDQLIQTLNSPLNGMSDIYWISFDKVLESMK